MAFHLPDLPYDLDALEPAIDARTMQIHHDKHHAGYVTKLNAAIEGLDVPQNVEALISDLSVIPQEQRSAVRNNGGGHANHSLFWQILCPPGQSCKPDGELAHAIDSAFGSLEGFHDQFADAAAKRFGSGWTWLGVSDAKLGICSTPNQDNPLMGSGFVDCTCIPILGLDVWEHAYYLKYQNRRPDYIKAFFDLINWYQVANNFNEARANARANARTNAGVA